MVNQTFFFKIDNIDPAKPVTLIHVLPNKSAAVWLKIVEQGIPAAPISQEGHRLNQSPNKLKHFLIGDKVITSRFCGVAMADVMTLLEKNGLFDLYATINRQKESIVKALKKANINHGHLHLGNFVVEFIKKDYYHQWMQENGNINHIPFTREKSTSNPVEYLAQPDSYEAVVRVIDFDLAKEV